MSVVSVHASRDYEVQIGRGLLSEAGARIRAVTEAKTAVIIAGEQVFPLYGRVVEESLRRAGFRVLHLVHPSGEQQKTLENYGRLLAFLSEKSLSRSDVLVALGGGVTGDLAGFAAATYQRGMDFVQIPITLLAMVDSSVGGKTAVNLPGGKNQVGCFYQPRLVLCDPDTLSTLPEAEMRCGCAEVVKYAMLGDPGLFAALEETPVPRQAERVIETCVKQKRDLVARDEYDRGCRRLLNLGHSFGHAIEACSGYTVRHGEAVAIGMAMITGAAVAKGVCPEADWERLLALLRQYRLPTETDFSAQQLAEAMRKDKKRSGDAVPLVIPEAIGRCRIETVNLEALPDWLRMGGAG